ncbi:DNA cytosine methyltransferase [Prevotella denticola]|uniref:DNA cytosine methyltransferase n=1 Tax=Prevotella denticola TaxID=28129 RepID=UPI00242BA69D|nr:DNA cytosine methyltransferase [Prevotella denticola]
MKVVDLFCGCGGLSLGFQQAGFDIIAAYDNWEAATEVYRLNFSHPVHKADLMNAARASESIMQYSPEMIIGGPPCQDYSSAGERNEDGGRAILTVRFAEIVTAVRPEWFVMENVSSIMKYSKVFEAMQIFHDAGYGLSYHILNAALCGVPQRRKRFFMVGRLGAADGFLDGYFIRHLASREMTMRDYFGETLGIDAYYRHPRSYARRGVFSMDEPSPTVRGVNRPMPSGYKLHHNDPVETLKGVRPLTTMERAEIQTFPSSYHWTGNKTAVEQMIGNAVPVKLAAYVGKAVNEYITDSEQRPVDYVKRELAVKVHRHIAV